MNTNAPNLGSVGSIKGLATIFRIDIDTDFVRKMHSAMNTAVERIFQQNRIDIESRQLDSAGMKAACLYDKIFVFERLSSERTLCRRVRKTGQP